MRTFRVHVGGRSATTGLSTVIRPGEGDRSFVVRRRSEEDRTARRAYGVRSTCMGCLQLPL